MMNKREACKIIKMFLKKRFNYFFLKKRLSDFAFTFTISGDGKDYIIKLIERKNIVSNIIHDKKHVSKIVLSTKIIGNIDSISSINVIDFYLSEKYSIFLLKKEKIHKIKIERNKDFKMISLAIFNFHYACRRISFKKLPWDNFPVHFKESLKNDNRWLEVNNFIRKNYKYIDKKKLVTCHNDIHEGNLYFLRNKIIFLDLDDMCKSSYFNDLGMLLANFMSSTYSSANLIEVIANIFEGYNLKMSKFNILNISLFALRKLYFTEAYFIYAKKNSSFSYPIYEIRKKVDILKYFINNYI